MLPILCAMLNGNVGCSTAPNMKKKNPFYYQHRKKSLRLTRAVGPIMVYHGHLITIKYPLRVLINHENVNITNTANPIPCYGRSFLFELELSYEVCCCTAVDSYCGKNSTLDHCSTVAYFEAYDYRLYTCDGTY